MLALATAAIAFWVVRDALQRDLQRALRADAERLAELYRDGGGQGGVSLTGPTGRVTIQLYGPGGDLLAASDPALEAPDARIPPAAFGSGDGATRDWSGVLAGRDVQAALAGFGVGYVAVIADTEFIAVALARLGRALLLTASVLVVLAAGLGYLVAGASIRPIRVLANLAAARGPGRLDPIEVRGPDDEVAQLARVLNDLMARLQEALDAQRVFLAETSHELRTPLTSLRGFLDRAHRRAPSDVRDDLADARRVAATMSRLVEDLLQLSRGQVVRELAPHLVDPYDDVVVPVADEFAVERVDGRSGATVLGDPERLRQLVRNLTANAVRAAGGAAGVALSVDADDEAVRIVVRDEGPGISEDVMPRIFEKFYKGAGGGSGLGLAIAQQIATHHGGVIALESAPGATTFTVRLPLAASEA